MQDYASDFLSALVLILFIAAIAVWAWAMCGLR